MSGYKWHRSTVDLFHTTYFSEKMSSIFQVKFHLPHAMHGANMVLFIRCIPMCVSVKIQNWTPVYQHTLFTQIKDVSKRSFSVKIQIWTQYTAHSIRMIPNIKWILKSWDCEHVNIKSEAVSIKRSKCTVETLSLLHESSGWLVDWFPRQHSPQGTPYASPNAKI